MPGLEFFFLVQQLALHGKRQNRGGASFEVTAVQVAALLCGQLQHCILSRRGGASFCCQVNQPHSIHVWYIYLHLVDFYGKCRLIYHTWMLWELICNLRV